MATLVHRIKDKVRSRSSSRSSRNSTDIPRASDRNAPNPSSPSSPTARKDGFPRTSLENSAFHVTRGTGGRASIDSPVTRKPLPSSVSQHQKKNSTATQQPGFEDIIPLRTSSRHGMEEAHTGAQHHAPAAEEQYFSAEENIPDRGSSRQADTTPSRALPLSNHRNPDSPARSHTRRISIPERLAPRQPADSELSKPLPDVPAAHKSNMAPVREPGHSATPTHDPVSSSAWLSPLISTGSRPAESLSTSQDKDAGKYEALARGHLRLPENFNLQDTEHTHVYETQRPAVTHETIIKQRTEIIREEITRDIHYHHYYTYLQPVKVVEVLPPKHYFHDLQTGVTTEVAPPPGWKLPANMAPVCPDTSHLAATTRHYLVNEEHPHGILEEPPAVQREPPSDGQRTRAL